MSEMAEVLERARRHATEYLEGLDRHSADGEARIEQRALEAALHWTPDWTRRARGFPIYAALRELGRDGVADLIERSCSYAGALTEGLGALDGAELVVRPRLNQGLVRFLDPAPGAGAAEHDAWTDRIVRAINDEGTAFFGPSSWQGRRVMRVSVVNWRTSEVDVERTLTAVGRVLSRERLWRSRPGCR